MSTRTDLLEQDASFELEDTQEPVPPPDIVAYNELRSCADLLRLHSSGKLEIQPDFQRDVVWKSNDQTRFIDSLVKQLPIPSMCFSLDYKTQKWKVIDGLQRMTSIIRVLSSSEWKLSDLPDIHPRLRNARNIELRNGDEEQRKLYSMIEDVSIPITVIRCDYSQMSHMRYLFTIFHRLNSGGMRLTNQEIRNCIYTSPFNDLLKKVDRDNDDWKTVKRRIWGSMERFRSIEVLLRVLAFGDQLANYDGNLARFLNDYMSTKLSLADNALVTVKTAIESVSSLAARALKAEPQKKLSLALIEALMVALYVNNPTVESASDNDLQSAYLQLKASPSFTNSARYAISSVENVRGRLSAAIKIFSN